MNDIPDRGMFDVIRAFQKDHGLIPNGEIRPTDVTLSAINSAFRTLFVRFIRSSKPFLLF